MQTTQTELVARFQCLGDKCEDTCCQNWSMQVDDATLSRYKNDAPELLSAVEEEGGLHVMKRDPATRHCIKMEDGLCGIHKKYGDIMLGDACHFYPRVTRALGDEKYMSATPSCPEVVRLMLSLDTPFASANAEITRLPQSLKNYLPPEMNAENAAIVHQAFMEAALDKNIAPERVLARISSVSRSLSMLNPATYHQSIPLYLRLADGRIAEPVNDPADVFNLLHALCGLIVASHKPVSPRLQKTISDMEQALGATLDWQNVQIALRADSPDLLTKIGAKWQPDHYAHALRRYLAMQLSVSLFPFAGLGADAAERITIIGVRFATVKLALACANALRGPLPEEEIVRIIQSISRFMDHLGDAAYSLAIYNETGWVKEARLLALFS